MTNNRYRPQKAKCVHFFSEKLISLLYSSMVFVVFLILALVTVWACSTPALASSQQNNMPIISVQSMVVQVNSFCERNSIEEHEKCTAAFYKYCKIVDSSADKLCTEFEKHYCSDYDRIDESCWNIDGDSTQTGGPSITDPQFETKLTPEEQQSVISAMYEAFKLMDPEEQKQVAEELRQLQRDGKLKLPFYDVVNGKNNLNNDFFYFTPLDFTVKHSLIVQFWTVSLMIVDAFIVVGVMLHGLNILLTGSYMKYSTALENFPKLFLALVVVHVSLLFVSVVLGLNNILCNFIYQWGNGMTYDVVYPTSKVTEARHILGPLAPAIPVQDTVILRVDWGPETMNFSDALGNFVDAAKMNIMEFALRMLALMLFVQVIMRLLFINFYIVTAPLALGCWALPGKLGGTVAGTWVKGFMSTVFVQLLQICAIVVINITQAGLFTYLRVDIQHSYLGNPDLVRIIQITIFLFLLRVPSLLGTASMQTIMSAGSSIQQAASAAIGAGVAVGASIAGAGGNAGGDLGSQAVQSLGKTIAARLR